MLACGSCIHKNDKDMENVSFRMAPSEMAAVTHGPTLCDFLMEAELAHYLNPLKNDLKISNVAQLKYVEQDDLSQLGMTKPEQRRLWKHFQKYCPQTYLKKIKNIIKPKLKKDSDRSSIYVSENTVDRGNVKVPSKHIIPFENIVINKQLGVGEFGVVQQGVWTNEEGERIQVAIKCLREEMMQKNHMEFLKEAAIMHSVDHENIVHLYGVVLETNALMLVTELAPLRSLLECLKEPALRQSFPVISLCDFAYQICDGMQYLESKKLIHRDLAARNILVFGKNKVKISDFGLSRALGVGKDYYQTNFNVNLKLPIAWCAPECINFMRFTSASDVWAYGVTLWEMFSYGFQPWAALTGQQILEAIDEPSFQRLEQPECCPREYYALMLKCWQHDANKRPKFCDILELLPEYKPIQVQAIQDFIESPCNSKPPKKDWLRYRNSDVIAVLDKKPCTDVPNLWKGVLGNGKTGLFNPAQTVSYLGHNLPTTTRAPSFSRMDGKGFYGSKRRLRTDMISRPQGDFKHTGHVGLDGAFFGDISCLGDKYLQLPKQVVAPYKPQDDKENVSPTLTSGSDSSDKTPLLISINSSANSNAELAADNWSDVFYDKEGERTSFLCDKPYKGHKTDPTQRNGNPDHEYHEINENEDDDDFNLLDGTKFECLDFGPSLVDEVLMALSSPKPDAVDGVDHRTNEITAKIESKESSKSTKDSFKKKHAIVKPISAADQQTLDSAIAMAKELASKSMLELDSKSDNETPTESPKTPNSPLKQKFSFKFKTSPKNDRRNFSEEAEAIPDIQDIITEEAKEAYNTLVQKGEVLTQSTSLPITLMPVSTAVTARNAIRKASQPLPAHQQMDAPDPEWEASDSSPLRMLRNGLPVKPKFRGNRHGIPGSGRAATPRTATVARIAAMAASDSLNSTSSHSASSVPSNTNTKSSLRESFTHSGSDSRTDELSDTSSTNTSVSCSENCSDNQSNPLPLPPRDRTKPLPHLKHHQRKYPLLIPGSISSSSSSASDASSHSLMKQASCPDVPSQTISPPSVLPIERRASEGGSALTSLSVEASASTTPNSSVTSSPLCTSKVLRSSLPQPPPKPARTYNTDDSLEQQIQAELDNLQNDNEEESQFMYKGGDHVSCEDLLEFALDKPNAHRTQGRARGIDSDEVRIMQKVLANENITPEQCLVALNETDWDVHKAIKCQKLQLMTTLQSLSTENSKQALEKCNWNVQQAANYLVAVHNVMEDTTEV